MKSTPVRPRIMFISLSDYDDLLVKGVSATLEERSEDGYFERVVSVHPLARRTRVVNIASNHQLIELGWDWLPGGEISKFLRLIYAPLYLGRALCRVIGTARKNNVNLIRANDPFVSGVIAYIASYVLGIPFCISLHTDYARAENRDISTRFPFAEIVSAFVLRRAALIMPISHFLGEYAINKGVDRQCIRVVEHGVDTDLFSRSKSSGSIRERFLIPKDVKIVLYVNRLSKQKYCFDALHAAALVKSEDVIFIFCGDGPELDAMQAEISVTPSLQKRVRILGFQPREVIAELASEADVALVLLAGFGLLEVCSAGLPPVVYDVEWQREIVIDGHSGFMVPEGDVKAVANRIDTLLADPALARSMGIRARHVVATKYSTNAARERRIAAYRSVLPLQTSPQEAEGTNKQ